MRKTIQLRRFPQVGDTRICSGWLLFPKVLRNRETKPWQLRWLEHATWIEQLFGSWEARGWIDEETDDGEWAKAVPSKGTVFC